MNKEFFTDNISDENLAKITDKMLNFEKNNKTKKIPTANIIKIVSAAAAILLFIGLINIIPMFVNNDIGPNGNVDPGTNVNTPVEKTTEYTEEIDPYAHVRFGETRDILLLDIEWHTPESFLEQIRNVFLRDPKSFLASFTEEQLNAVWEYTASQIAEGQQWASKRINGKESNSIWITPDNSKISFTGKGAEFEVEGDYLTKEEIASHFDENGYYIFVIYSHTPWPFYYIDENGEAQYKEFTQTNSKSEYHYVLENEVIPFCDELLEKGLLTQEQYDYYTTFDPLDYYVDLFFNITFPVSDKGKTEYNTAIYEAEPFALSVQLPEKWSYKERESDSDIDNRFTFFEVVCSVLDIYNENGELVGAVGYNIYEEYEGAENDPRAIYSQIALGNNYHFDVRDSYAVVKETDSGMTATADVYYSANINDGTEMINKGILSYNRDLLVYIAMEFDSDLVTNEQIINIAQSIIIK